MDSHSFHSRINALRALTKRSLESFSFPERFSFWILVWIFIITATLLLLRLNERFLVEVPAEGGHLTEGIIGAPRFINPLLAASDADRDLSALVYAGLLRSMPDGHLVPDLASRYEISEDGTVYTFFLRDDIYFHDGVKITTDDVEFTILKAQDSVLKSPKRATWDGVVVEKIGAQEIRFTLKHPYSPFLENTILGIIPKHIWKNADSEQFSFSEFNVQPIGSGPYKVSHIERNSSGIPTYYDLTPFRKYALGNAYINDIRIRFYSNESSLIEALKRGEIESVNAISPIIAEELKGLGFRVEKSPLPRIFGVFFNQNAQTIFTDQKVREALDIAVDKDRIIREVLLGYGTRIDGPIPPGALGYSLDEKPEDLEDRISDAEAILEKAGWSMNEETRTREKKTKTSTTELSFSIATSNVPELKRAAEIVKENWERLGARVELKVFEPGDLNQNVIRPRKYDALLFGEIVGRESDLFAFWHSSQRNDPGLNVALYTNATVDKLLQQARTVSNTAERIGYYQEFEKEIAADTPAIFLYSPDFIYIVPDKLKGFSIGALSVPGERFFSTYTWFIETNKIWKIFNR